MPDPTKLTLIIPEDLILKPPITWSPASVLAFLEANKEQYYLDDEDISRIHDNKVSGLVFLKLTREQLLEAPYKLLGGPAVIIQELAKELLLIRETKPSSQELQSELTQQVYSYRINSGIMSSSSSQLHGDLDSYILHELSGNVHIDVGGFENIFDPILDNLDFPNTSVSTIPDWMKLRKGWCSSGIEFENYGVNFFEEFSTHENAKSSGRCFRGSGSKTLKDAHHEAKRKADIFLLSQEHLPNGDSQEHLPNGDSQEHLPNGDSKEHLPNGDSTKFSWKNVLVVGEFKYAEDLDIDKSTLKQLASYVREIFGAQPGRRFVYAFTVCGKIARLWLYDRAGVSISKMIDISTEDGSKAFRRAMLGFMRMSESDLGIGESASGSLTVQGKNIELLEVIFHSHSIVSRGTVCWRAEVRDTDGTRKSCVVKECWRNQSEASEVKFWEHAKEKHVLGSLDILMSCDLEYACKGFGQENNIRRKLDYKDAKKPPFKKWWPSSSLLESITESTSKPVQTQSIPTSKKRKNEAATTQSKRIKTLQGKGKVEGRVHALMVMGNVGQRLETIKCPRVLLEVLRDAIKCHRSLYEDGGILHCDISHNNVMMNAETSGPKGFLIDLDNARYQIVSTKVTDTPPESSLQVPPKLDEKTVTGTPPFMALELLMKRPITQTWRHDLESFLYVLIWTCIQNPFVTLSQWREGLKDPKTIENKRDNMSQGFKDILKLFKPEFEKVKPVATRLRNILFYDDEPKFEMTYTTPLGDRARKEMYDKVIQAFDDGIDRIRV